MKQQELSRWLRMIVLLTGAITAVFLCLIAPSMGQDIAAANPEYAFMLAPALIFLAVSAVPFYLALYRAYRVLQQVGRDHSFCAENAAHLKAISRLALIDTLWYFLGAVALVIGNVGHPSVLLGMGLVIFIGVAAAVAAATLSHLVQKAAALQSENELTI